jgi:glycyl-tRNA synthetase
VEDAAAVAWLRPETAQGIFVNFDNVQQSMRRKLPFGIAQVGKSFRNEITPGKFIFRSREFEQMEMQYFVRPEDAPRIYDEWKETRRQWFRDLAGHDELFRFREHADNERAFYAAQAFDIEFQFPFLCAAYDEEPDKEGVRVVLRLHHDLAPYKVAVLPLSKKPELSELARSVWAKVRPAFQSTFDETQAIGRRYRRQDEIGTPLCVTVDFDSLTDHAVTIRERDSMAQVRVKIEELVPALQEKLDLA